MNDGTLTIRELLAHPDVQGLVTQEDAERIAECLGAYGQVSKDPMYIRILSGVGAWFAALSLISFLGISRILENSAGAIICGIIFLVCAIIVARASKSTFVSQLCLALVFSGSILVPFGSAGALRSHELSVVVLTHAIICAIVYPLYANGIYRFLAPTALVTLVTAWIFEEKVFVLIHVLIAAEILLAGILLLRKKRPPLLTPLAYSSAAMLPATLLFMTLTQVTVWRPLFDEPLWPSSMLLAGSLISLFFHLAGGWKRLREPWMILAIVSAILIGIFTTPGILVAIGLLVVGYAFGDRKLMGMSYLFLPCFLVVFYYALNIDLAHKSWVVAGSGVILLVVRWITGHFQPKEVAI